MKTKLSSLLLIFLLLGISACGSGENTDGEETNEETVDYDQFMQELVELENKINANVAAPDKEVLKEAIVKYQDLAGYFPEDPKAPEYLFKASDLALSTGQPEKAVKILSRIMEEYPQYERMEDVMFNKASHLDFELRDTTAAKELYAEFIKKYPESELVDDAQSRIENISLSLEELVEKFMANIEENPEVSSGD